MEGQAVYFANGTCLMCGCTDDEACVLATGGPCGWANAQCTVCTNPLCLAKARMAPEADEVSIQPLSSVLMTGKELDSFLSHVGHRMGDPSAAVALLCVGWAAFPGGAELAVRWDNEVRVLMLEMVRADHVAQLPIRVSAEGIEMRADSLHAFHVRRVSAGVWALAPSLNIPGVMHSFVVLHGVPEPPPWESRIIVASSKEFERR